MSREYADFTGIADLIGEKSARMLCDFYGGHTVYIPNPDKNKHRDALIKKQRKRGLLVKNIAHINNVTERTVHRVVARG